MIEKPPTVAKIIDAEAEQKKKMHINNPTTISPPATPPTKKMYIQPQESKKDSPPTGMDSNKPMYIQKPEGTWISDREKNDTIIIESLLARSVEIVNANYSAFESQRSPAEFMELLDARCVLVERITDRLFDYLKKKVKNEQNKK